MTRTYSAHQREFSTVVWIVGRLGTAITLDALLACAHCTNLPTSSFGTERCLDLWGFGCGCAVFLG